MNYNCKHTWKSCEELVFADRSPADVVCEDCWTGAKHKIIERPTGNTETAEIDELSIAPVYFMGELEVISIKDVEGRDVWVCPVCGLTELAHDPDGKQTNAPFTADENDANIWHCQCGAMLTAP